MKIFDSVTELVGRTPLLKVNNLISSRGLQADVLVKLECMNPAGSAKDRVGLSMILDAQARGVIQPGATIIEPTSGNTGIGLASAAAALGYRVLLTMPDSMSAERIALLKAYGAQVVLTPGALGMAGAIEKANELAASTPGSFVPGQFDNPANPDAHYRTTGPEIWQDTAGSVDMFVAGVGTGGTITGAGRYLKEQNPHIRVIGVEPADSPVLSGGQAGPHGLMGIGAGFVPGALDTAVYDEIITVTSQQAYAAARTMAREEGVLVGITSGAALHAAIQLAQLAENKGKTIVALLPDTGERYLSTPLFSE